MLLIIPIAIIIKSLLVYCFVMQSDLLFPTYNLNHFLQVLVGLFLGWINSILLAIPPLFNAAPYRYLSGLGACAPEFRTGIASVWYAAAYTGFTLLLPATVFICCNVKVSNNRSLILIMCCILQNLFLFLSFKLVGLIASIDFWSFNLLHKLKCIIST